MSEEFKLTAYDLENSRVLVDAIAEAQPGLWECPHPQPQRRRPRKSLRNTVKCSAKQLAARAHKYLSLSAEYKARDAWQRKQHEPDAPYTQRIASLPTSRTTRQAPCKAFESGRNTLDFFIPSEQHREAA